MKERPCIMENIIVFSPILKKRFEGIIKHCMSKGTFKKPDNVTWSEVAFTFMLVIAEKELKNWKICTEHGNITKEEGDSYIG